MSSWKTTSALLTLGALAVLAYGVFVLGEGLAVAVTLIAVIAVRGLFLLVERSEIDDRYLHGVVIVFIAGSVGYFYLNDIGSPIVPVAILGFGAVFVGRIT